MVAYAATGLNLPASVTDTIATMAMFEIRDNLWIPGDDLKTQWMLLGLPESECPTPRSRNDAFRKATADFSHRQYRLMPYDGKGLRPGEVMAAVLVKSTGAKTRVSMTHKNRCTIVLRENGNVEYRSALDLTHQEGRLLEQVGREYERALAEVDGGLLRGAMKRLMTQNHAVKVRKGVELVPQTHAAIVGKLAALVRWSNDYLQSEPSLAITVTYMGTADQKDQLKTVVEAHVKHEIELKFAEIAGYINRQGKAGERKKESVLSDVMDLGTLIGAYEAVLGEAMSDLHRYLGMQSVLLTEAMNR